MAAAAVVVVALKVLLPDRGGTTLTLQVDTDTTFADLTRQISEKSPLHAQQQLLLPHAASTSSNPTDQRRISATSTFSAAANDSSTHGLFWPDKSKWLVPTKTLKFYGFKTGDRVEFKRKHRELKVRLPPTAAAPDGSLASMLVDESAPVRDLVAAVCERFVSHPEEFSFAADPGDLARSASTTDQKSPIRSSTASLSTPSAKTMSTRGDVWLNPQQTLPEQGIIDSEAVLLKRRFFVNEETLNRDDAAQIAQVYEVSRDGIISGSQPCRYEDAITLAALQCQSQYGNFEPDRHRPSFFKLKDMVSPDYRNHRDILKRIISDYEKLYGMSDLTAKFNYVQHARSLKTYGITFFAVKEKLPKRSKTSDILLGITKNTIVRMDVETKDILMSWPLTQLRRWGAASNSMTLDFGSSPDSYYTVQTLEGEKISQLISGYIDIIVRKRRQASQDVSKEDILKVQSIESVRTVDSLENPVPALPAKINMGRLRGGSRSTISRAGSDISDPSPLEPSPFEFESPLLSVAGRHVAAAQQSLLMAVKSGYAMTVRTTSDVELGLRLSTSSETVNTLRGKEKAANFNSHIVAAHISAHLGSIGAIINHVTEDLESIDYQTLEMHVNLLISNLSKMSVGLKKYALICEDDTDRDAILDGAKSFSKATASVLEAVQAIVTGQATTKERLFVSVRDVSIASSDLLVLIGRLEVPEDVQTDLMDSARVVARGVADVVFLAKKIASSLSQQHAQLQLATRAKSAAEAANLIVACTTAVAPVMTVQLCLDQVLEASITMRDSLILLSDASSACQDQNLVSSITTAVEVVQEAIATLLDRAKRCSTGVDESPMDSDLEQVMLAVDGMTERISTTDGIVASAKYLTLSSTFLANNIRKASLSGAITEAERERLAGSARLIAECTSKMVAAAKDAARSPSDLEKRTRLSQAVDGVKDAANAASGSSMAKVALRRLFRSLKKVFASEQQLILGSYHAAPMNRNQASQVDVNRLLKKAETLISDTSTGIAVFTVEPSSPVAQLRLLREAKNVSLVLRSLVAAVKVAFPTSGDSSLLAHMANLVKQVTGDLDALDKAVTLVENVCTLLKLESACIAADVLQKDLESKEPERFVVGTEEWTADLAEEQLRSSTRSIQSAVDELLAATAEHNVKAAGDSANQLVDDLRTFAAAIYALARFGATDQSSQGPALSSSTVVAGCIVPLIANVKNVFTTDNPGDTSALETFAEEARVAISDLFANSPGSLELARARRTLEEFTEVVSTAALISGGANDVSFPLAQIKLQSAAAAVTVSVHSLSAAVRGGPIELQNSAKNYLAGYTRLIEAVKLVCTARGDIDMADQLTFALKQSCSAAIAFLRTADVLRASPSDLRLRNQLLDVASEVEYTISELLELCTTSAPGHSECSTALATIISASSRLDGLNDGSLSEFTYGGCVQKMSDGAKQINILYSQVLAAALASDTQKMANDLILAAQTVGALASAASRAAYLIGIADPESTPAVPSIVDQTTFAQAANDIRESCKLLVDPKNTQTQILELAGSIARHTSKLCNACKIAGADSSLDIPSRQSFISFAKDVASKTAILVASIKQLAVSLDEDSRKNATNAYNPLLDGVEKLVAFAFSPEFSAVPARIAVQAASAQKPVIDASRGIIYASQDIISTAKMICTNPTDHAALELLAAGVKAISEFSRLLVEAASNSASGQRECNEALLATAQIVGTVQKAMLEVTTRSLTPQPGVQKGALAETSRAIASLVDVVARAALLDEKQLRSSILEVPDSLKKCSEIAIAVVSNESEVTVQMQILEDTKALCDRVSSFISAVKKACLQPIDSTGEAAVDSERENVRQAVSRLLTAVDGPTDEAGFFSKATERVELRISTLNYQIPAKPNHSYQVLMEEIGTLTKQFAALVGDVVSKSESPDRLEDAARKLSESFEGLCDVSCEAISGTNEDITRIAIMDAVRQLGGATIRLIDGIRFACGSGEQQVFVRLKLAQAGRDVSSGLSALILSVKEGARGVRLCERAVTQISDVILDFESSYIFAQSGNLDPIDPRDSFSNHKDGLLTATKDLTGIVKSVLTAMAGTQEDIAKVALETIEAVDSLRNHIRGGAISLSSANKVMQQQLLASAKYVGESLQSIFQHAISSIGKRALTIGDPAGSSELAEAVKTGLYAIGELVKVTKSVGDEANRELRVLDEAIRSIETSIETLDTEFPPQGSAAPQEIAHIARQMTTTTASLVTAALNSPSPSRQTDLIAASNAIRKQAENLVLAGLSATVKAPKTLRSDVLSAVKSTAVAAQGLVRRVRELSSGTDPKTEEENGANRAAFHSAARQVAQGVTAITVAVEALARVFRPDSPDPAAAAVESELISAAASIDAALQSLSTPAGGTAAHALPEDVSFDDTQLDPALVDGVRAIAAASAALVHSATDLQRDISSASESLSSSLFTSGSGQVRRQARDPLSSSYFTDGTWSDGLVSAAKRVAAATSDLCAAVIAPLSQDHYSSEQQHRNYAEADRQAAAVESQVVGAAQKHDRLPRVLAAAHAVAAATAHVVSAATVAGEKAAANSSVTGPRTNAATTTSDGAGSSSNSAAAANVLRVRAAGRSVTHATALLVKAAEQALAFVGSVEMADAMVRDAAATAFDGRGAGTGGGSPSVANMRAMEMDAQVAILKMERELEMARVKLAAVRKGRYDRGRRDNGGSK
ncbi:hypothetical protein DFJ73DRAFT_50493 [Zopfochytrium polystomum]|nr:hypothetical protein DFJ73DRAFT_50493 [Zopfochytrium polystomum]